MNEKQEIKPVRCGCGGQAEMLMFFQQQKNRYVYKVYCSECYISTIAFPTEKQAIEEWNTAMGTNVRMLMKVFAYDATCGVCEKNRKAKVKVHEHPCGISGKCLSCGGDVYNEDPYCSHCGVKLDWGK